MARMPRVWEHPPNTAWTWRERLQNPEVLSIPPSQNQEPPLILELGCGLGMASLVINARGGDILATDYHPRAEVFLHDNSRRNALTDTPFQRLDWRMPNPDLGVFDLIIGSDLLYEPDHPVLLSEFLARHSDATTRIIIVDPKRRLHVRFRKRMEAAGFTSQSDAGTPAQWAAFGFKGVVQRFDCFSPLR